MLSRPRGSRLLLALGGCGLLWVALIAPLSQGGWTALGAYWAVYWPAIVIAILATSVLRALRRHGTQGALATAAVAAALAWLWAGGALTSWQSGFWLVDASGFGLSALAIWLLAKRARFSRDRSRGVVSWALLAWLLISAISAVRDRTPLLTDAARFSSIGPSHSIIPTEARAWEGLRIGLTLSGGGYRAAVFHAGLLSGFEDIGVRVSTLTTVSGGSIIGAYYAVGGDPQAFVAAMSEGRFDVRRRLMLAHNAVRLILPMTVPGTSVELLPFGRFDRLDVQRGLIEQVLLGSARLHAGVGNRDPDFGQPLLMIAVTDLAYGGQLGLLPDGFVRVGHGDTSWAVFRASVHQAEREMNLAERVAVSGAFPMAFPPRPYRVGLTPFKATTASWRDLLLVDGGLRDNTGADLARAAWKLSGYTGQYPPTPDYRTPREWAVDALIVSDASAVRTVADSSERGVALLPRAFDVAGTPANYPVRNLYDCDRLIDMPLTISPLKHLTTIEARFDPQFVLGSQEADDPLVGWWPPAYPQALVQRLAGLWPDAGGRRQMLARALFEGIETHQVRGREFANASLRAYDSGECSAGGPTKPDIPAGACETATLRNEIASLIEDDVRTFAATSTLDDRLPIDTVEGLARLGRALVYVYWRDLANYVARVQPCRGHTR